MTPIPHDLHQNESIQYPPLDPVAYQLFAMWHISKSAQFNYLEMKTFLDNFDHLVW